MFLTHYFKINLKYRPKHYLTFYTFRFDSLYVRQQNLSRFKWNEINFPFCAKVLIVGAQISNSVKTVKKIVIFGRLDSTLAENEFGAITTKFDFARLLFLSTGCYTRFFDHFSV